MRARFFLVTCVAVFALVGAKTSSADLALDSSFALDGIADIDVGTGLDSARDIAVQSDGSYVLVGMSRQTTGNMYDYATIVRLNDAGTLDGDFGDAGTVKLLPGGTPQAYGGADARAVLVQPDDQKIVVVGSWNVNDGNGWRVFALRLSAGGTLDSGFGDAGVTIVQLPGFVSNAQAEDVALQSSGSIIISGSMQRAFSDPEGFVLRLTADGDLDLSFGTDGVFATTDPVTPGASFGFNAVKVGEADTIVAAGGMFDMVVTKLSSDGQPDSAFDGDGIAVLNYTSGEIQGFPIDSTDNANGVALLADGKILVAGSVQPDVTVNKSSVAVARITAAGALDASFGTGGYALLPAQPGQQVAYDVVVRPSGDMVVSGVGFKPVQVSPNGTAFSVLGAAFPPQSINGLAVLDDGRVVGGGEQNVGGANYEMVGVRFDVTDLADGGCVGPGGGPLCGDLTDDCAIKAGDALIALRMAVDAVPGDQKADVNGDGRVTAGDALLILRVAVGGAEPTGDCNG